MASAQPPRDEQEKGKRTGSCLLDGQEALAKRYRRSDFTSHVVEEEYCHYSVVPARQQFTHRDTSIYYGMSMLKTNRFFYILRCLRSY